MCNFPEVPLKGRSALKEFASSPPLSLSTPSPNHVRPHAIQEKELNWPAP